MREPILRHTEHREDIKAVRGVALGAGHQEALLRLALGLPEDANAVALRGVVPPHPLAPWFFHTKCPPNARGISPTASPPLLKHGQMPSKYKWPASTRSKRRQMLSTELQCHLGVGVVVEEAHEVPDHAAEEHRAEAHQVPRGRALHHGLARGDELLRVARLTSGSERSDAPQKGPRPWKPKADHVACGLSQAEALLCSRSCGLTLVPLMGNFSLSDHLTSGRISRSPGLSGGSDTVMPARPQWHAEANKHVHCMPTLAKRSTPQVQRTCPN